MKRRLKKKPGGTQRACCVLYALTCELDLLCAAKIVVPAVDLIYVRKIKINGSWYFFGG
jgi:hypothetical protein